MNFTEHYADINARTIDRWVEAGWEWGVPITREVFADAQNGTWDVLLSPIQPVPHEWFLPFLKNNRLDGARLLGLASGGGQQMPVFAAIGAECTGLDYSAKQLEAERAVAEREGYAIHIVRADMTLRLPFGDAAFDIVFHPVSNCYVEDVHHVWRECHRVLRPGGILLSGLDSGFDFLYDNNDRPRVIVNSLPFNPLKNPAHKAKTRDCDSVQFGHTFDGLIGGQLKAGFVLTAAYEDYNNNPESIADGIPSYWVTRAVKP